MTASRARPKKPRPLLLGHRGARGVKSIPENSIASFDRCMADGCDGFEFDVRLTADGEAVVFHDPKVARFAIARSKADQLPDLPRLREILARYRNAFLDIELKVAGVEKIVVEEMKIRRLKRCVVSSFLPEVLETMCELDRTIPLGLICETRKQLQRWTKLPVACVIPNLTLVDQNLLSELHAAGKKVIVWTVNRAPDMRRLAGWGVYGIVSDRPKLLSTTLRSQAELI
jgi:glycerophosphoryl diester phosphodiesterase